MAPMIFQRLYKSLLHVKVKRYCFCLKSSVFVKEGSSIFWLKKTIVSNDLGFGAQLPNHRVVYQGGKAT